MPLLHAISPRRLTFGLSVRARLVAIILIPVVGFLANGFAFMSGERKVDVAFDSVRRAALLADASREFKSAVVTIQTAARAFAEHPRSGYLQVLADSQRLATAQFAMIRQLSAGEDQSYLDAIERTLKRLESNFA